MTQNENQRDEIVAQFLTKVRESEQSVPTDLLQRVVQDAESLQPSPSLISALREVLRGFSKSIGGWPALSGLAAAGCVGFWIGINPPEGLADPADLFFVPQYEAFEDAAGLAGFGWDVREG